MGAKREQMTFGFTQTGACTVYCQEGLKRDFQSLPSAGVSRHHGFTSRPATTHIKDPRGRAQPRRAPSHICLMPALGMCNVVGKLGHCALSASSSPDLVRTALGAVPTDEAGEATLDVGESNRRQACERQRETATTWETND